jgi:heptosyltransferase-2
MSSLKKILIVRTDRIGDVVLSLPLAQLIKQKYPDSKVSYFLRKYTSSLLDGNPFIDEVIIAEEANGQINFVPNLEKIKSKSFDACIVVNPTLKIALMMFLAGIKKRIGTGYRWYSVLFNEKVFEHRKYGEKHEIEYNLNLLKKIEINVNGIPDKIDFHLSVDEESDGRINEILTSNGFKKENRLVIIHPGSGGSSVDLPTEKLIDLTRRINELNNVKVVITGSQNELELCRKFEIGSSIINLAGSLDVSLLKALIKKTDLFISNSTGPIHIAAAFGVYVIGFYPKIPACSEKRWGPYTEKKTIFSPTIECNNCTREQCEKLNCMNSIDIGRVFDETRSVLKI